MTPSPATIVVVPAVAFLASLLGVRVVLAVLERRAILDRPNERSSHTAPTPRGAGLAVVPMVAAAWALTGMAAGDARAPAVAALALALGLLSWLDDLHHVRPHWRLAAQAAAVAAALAWMPGAGPYFGGWLPGALDAVAAGLLWLWFVNLFNFMDGIDAMAGTESVCLGAGAALVVAVAGLAPEAMLYGLAAAAAAAGFLVWNRPPARIFLGDVGSVPLGFLFGWLLLELAAQGQWAAALILPLYYLADSSLTLARRVVRLEPVWRAHRQHFYQRAVERGCGHGAVVRAVALADAALLALAALAAGGRPWHALAGAGAVVALLLAYLGRRGAARRPSPPAAPHAEPRP